MFIAGQLKKKKHKFEVSKEWNMKHVFVIIVLIGLFSRSYAQIVEVHIFNEQNEPLPGATVSLRHEELQREYHSIADSSGIVQFGMLPEGNYTIQVRFIGYQLHQAKIVVADSTYRYDVVLSAVAKSLREVTVTAARPIIRQEDDKMIIDPEPMANVSTNALEIIESTPGIYVDPDGGIFLAGTSPAAIYINGRQQKMSQQDLNYLLRSIPPNAIERIEILRTPSAKYDAATSGGIVNIVLKKGVRLGKYGTLSAGTLQGKRNNTFLSASYNDQLNGLNYYLTLNGNANNRLEELETLRVFENNSLSINSVTTPQNQQIFFQSGINGYLRPQFQVHYDGRLSLNNRNMLSENLAMIHAVDQLLPFNVQNEYHTEAIFLSTNHDVGFLWELDTAGNQIDSKFSFTYNRNTSEQEYTNRVINPFSFMQSGNGIESSQRYFVMYQMDVTYILPFQIKCETGVKSAYQLFCNRSTYTREMETYTLLDTQKTVRYEYSDIISAGYVQLSRELFLKLNLKTGLRAEHTYMDGSQSYPVNAHFVVHRWDVFPYIYLSRKIFEGFGVKLFSYAIYRRTITRPDYQQLNPSVRSYDQFFYERGNPKLKPQFSENIEWNISFNDFPVLAIGITRTNQIFSQVTYSHPTNAAIIVRTFDNLGNSVERYARGIVGIPPGKRYFFGAGAQYSDVNFEGLYDQQPFKFRNHHWRLFTFHSLRLFKNTRITAFGFYLINFAWNFYQVENFGQLNLNFSQTLFNQKLTISLNFRDVLNTNYQQFVFEQGQMYMTGSRRSDTQRIGINIKYNFGIKPKPKNRELFQEQSEIEFPD